jgi:predicted phosphodiesterase
MPRLAILADIHGNLPALEAVLTDLARYRVDQVIVAGDVINWGPFSAQVMARVAGDGWIAVRGNNEDYLLDYDTPRAPPEWSDRSQWGMLAWLRAQLAGRWHAAIAAWPDSLCLRYPDAPPIRVVHGSPRSNSEPLYPQAANAELAQRLAGVSEPTVIAAHTHLPMHRLVPGRLPGGGSSSRAWQLLNPGSVGVPLAGRHHASYLLLDGSLDGWRPTFRTVPIDPGPVLAEFERQRFADHCGIVAHFVLAEFRHARLELSPFLRWRRAACPDAPFTPALLEAYQRIDPLPYVLEPYRSGWQESKNGRG